MTRWTPIALVLALAAGAAHAAPTTAVPYGQPGLGINMNSLNLAIDPGPGSSQYYGGTPLYDPRYSLPYEGFSSGMYPRNYYPQSGFYDYYAANKLKAPTSTNLINGLFDVFFGEGGDMGTRWHSFWRDSLAKPYGLKAFYLLLGRSGIDRYLGAAGRYAQGVTGSGRPGTYGRCGTGTSPFGTNPNAGIGQIFSGSSTTGQRTNAIAQTALMAPYANQTVGGLYNCGDAGSASRLVGAGGSSTGSGTNQECWRLGFKTLTQCIRCNFDPACPSVR